MDILIACEYSGRVANAFQVKGHNVLSCDLLPNENFANHVTGDVTELLRSKWDLVIAHPPCTYIAKSRGVCDLPRLQEASVFFNKCLSANSERICVENPMPFRVAYDYIPRPNHWICPSQFGSMYTKFTCLWLKGLPPLMPTLYYPRCSTKSLVYSTKGSKNRSKTDIAIATAMAEQWDF